MKCTYTLLDSSGNEHVFKSELALDDFLLLRGEYQSTLGDVVFSMTDPQASICGTLEKISQKTKSVVEDGNKLFFDGYETLKDTKRPYIGVNRFLSQYTAENGELLFPLFIEENFWEGVLQPDGSTRVGGRYNEWKNGKFSDAEVAVLETMGVTCTQVKENEWTGPAITDPVLAKDLRAKVEEKWEIQCLSGDAVHKVLQMYFSPIDPDGKDTRLYKDVIDSDPAMKQKFIVELKAQTFRRKARAGVLSKISLADLMSDACIEQTIQQAKALADKLRKRFGDDAQYFPEFEITAELNQEYDGARHLYGIIDLLVVDKDGRCHIFDYKTSIKPYEKFHSSKSLAFKYQIAAYKLMLGQWGIHFDDNEKKNQLAIVPIQLDDFKAGGPNKWTFSGIKLAEKVEPSGTITPIIWYDQNNEILNTKNGIIYDRLLVVVPAPVRQTIVAKELRQNVLKDRQALFPTYKAYETVTDEMVTASIKDAGGYEIQKDGEHVGKMVYNPAGSWMKPIVIDPAKSEHPEQDMFNAVQKRMQYALTNRKRTTNQIIKALQDGLEAGSVQAALESFPENRTANDPGSSPEWFLINMSKYCNSLWEVVTDIEGGSLSDLGVILLYNKTSHLYDVIKISGQSLLDRFIDAELNSSNQRNLAWRFKDDTYYATNDKSLMMESRIGNVELMETMMILNHLDNAFLDAVVGLVLVVNPVYGQGIKAATNEELVWTFNELDKVSDTHLSENNIKSGKVKFATQTHIANQMFHLIMNLGEERGWVGEYAVYNKNGNDKKFTRCMSELDATLENTADMAVKYEKLKELAALLKESDKNHKLNDLQASTTMEQTSDIHTQLYFLVLLAMAELKGLNFRQQLDEHSLWLDLQMAKKFGISGLAFDNPGNMSSELLNQMTKLTTEAYQNVRTRMQDPIGKMREMVEKLKKDKGYNKLLEYTVGNETTLYQKMFDFSKPDFLFRRLNDPSLSNVEREFLEYVLDTINKNRFANMSESDLEAMKKGGSDAYYRVPLMKGDTASVAAQKGWWKAFKDYLSSWNPKNVVQRAKAMAGEFLSAKEERARKSGVANFFEMRNLFDAGEDLESREKMLADGFEQWETNLETLLLTHQFAYETKRLIDDIMPLLHASMINLHQLGNQINTTFTADINWMHDYIKNKVRGESLIEDGSRMYSEYINKIKSAASKLALGFAPVQFLYQSLQGIWNDISLIWRKPDGSSAFTFSNFKKAAKIVYADMFKPGDKPTISSRLNLLYGINDQDMNNYAKLNRYNKHGIFNFDRFLFRFASRPDFYNRMLLFEAKMIEDGSLEAHSLNKDGYLEYDWTRDKRFSKYAADPTSLDPEVVNLRALYIAMAQQFISEHAQVKVNGKLVNFELIPDKPMPLPQAYTNKEAESMKSISDTVYGYYSHEKKSMFQSTLMGGLAFQFRTYWSGKKNQYFGAGGVKLEGKWELYSEMQTDEKGNQVEVKYYYQTDANGNPLYNDPPIPATEATNLNYPVFLWKGNWKEGIAHTVALLCGEIVKDGFHPINGFNAMWYNPDTQLRNAYRNNLKQLAYDVVMFMIIGNILAALMSGWYKDLEDESDRTDIADGLKLTAANILCRSVKNSFLDFNFIESIGVPATQWSPFAFLYITNLMGNIVDFATGDQDLYKTIIKSSSATRLWKPFLDAVHAQTEE